MTKQEKIDQVKVFMEFINYLGKVNESVEIATFRNIGWGKSFIKDLLNHVDEDDELINGLRYKIQFGDGRVAYITKDGENEFVKSL